MEYFLVIVPFFALLFLVTRPLTVLFHELGHAVPLIVMTDEKASVYIGSYGDPTKSIHFNIGRLDIWFKYNPFFWQYGVCVPYAKQISVNRQIIYTLSGPLASFTIAVIACYFTFSYNLHGAVKLVLIIFLSSSVYDLLLNLTPNSKAIILFDGSIAYNDGYQLKQLFYHKQFSHKYEQAARFYNEQKYAEAAIAFNNILNSGWKDAGIYGPAISSFVLIKNYKKAIELTDAFMPLGQLKSDDYSNAGLAYSQLGLYDQALGIYDRSLQLNPSNKSSLNNKGYTLNLLGKFEEAIKLFDRAVELDPSFAYSYNNRGLAKIKIGKTEEGLEDISHSFKLDSDNSYAYRNLGIYHLDRGDFAKALELFTKAKELDSETHMIDELIGKATQ